MRAHINVHCQNLKSGNDADQLSASPFLLLSYCQQYPAAWGIDSFMVSLQIILYTDWALLRVPNHHIHKNVNTFCCPFAMQQRKFKEIEKFASYSCQYKC